MLKKVHWQREMTTCIKIKLATFSGHIMVWGQVEYVVSMGQFEYVVTMRQCEYVVTTAQFS